MADLNDLLRVGGKRLDLADDIEALQALATIRERWDELREKEPTLSGVIEFVEALIGEQPGGPMSTLLDSIDLDGEKIRAALTKAADALKSIDPKYRTLLKPLKEFDETADTKDLGLVDWKAAGRREGAGSGRKVSHTFEVGAKATLVLEAGDAWPEDDAGMPDPLLRIGFIGEFEAAAGAKRPLSSGSVGLSADALREAYLDYYFDAGKGTELYAASVATRLRDLPNPLSLASVWDHFQRSDIAGFVLETEGESSLTVNVGLAEGFQLAHDLKLGVGIDISAKVTRTGTFYLKLRKLADAADQSMAVELAIERSQTRGREVGVELGVELDAAALARRLIAIVNHHEQRLEGVLDEVRDYLTPGTYLRNEGKERLSKFIDDVVADNKLKAALEDAANRALGLGRAGRKSKLEKFVSEEITEQFDAASGIITGRLDEVAREVGAAFTKKTGLPSTLLDTAKAKIEDLIKSVRTDLEERVKKSVNSPASKLVEALDRAGEQVSSAGNKADQALEGVRNVIARYEKALKALKEAAADAARQRVTAKIIAESRGETGASVEARISFLKASEDNDEVYSDLVSGEFDRVLDLIEEPERFPDLQVDLGNTALSRFRSSGSTTGYTLVLFGFEFGTSTVFDSTSRVTVDGAGRVSVVSDATWKRTINTPKEDREITFIDAYELAAASATKELSVHLTINHTDEVLRRNEVSEMIGSFESANLLPPGTRLEALSVFDRWFGPGDRKGIVADICFSLSLDHQRLMRLIRLGNRDGSGNLSTEARFVVFETALVELLESGAHEHDAVDRWISEVRNRVAEDSTASNANILYRYSKRTHDQVMNTLSPSVQKRARNNLDRAIGLRGLCMSLVDLLEELGHIYEATPALVAEADGWTEQDYDEAQQRIARHLKRWIKAGSRILWIAAEAHPRTVAFVGALVALSEIAERSDQGLLTLKMTRRTEEPESVVLV